MFQLPSYEECETAVKLRRANPLQQFIVDNEPAGERKEKEFRDGLSELCDYLMGETKKAKGE
jgi:hypothetical protein